MDVQFSAHESLSIFTQVIAPLVIVQSRVNALIDMKLEKYKNLWEESCFYWHEISNGTLKFDRTEREVSNLLHFSTTYRYKSCQFLFPFLNVFTLGWWKFQHEIGEGKAGKNWK